jgi:hypothetical protein
MSVDIIVCDVELDEWSSAEYVEMWKCEHVWLTVHGVSWWRKVEHGGGCG